MRNGDVKRRKADGSRWLTAAAMVRHLPLSETTLSRWRKVGVVRTENRWVSVDDVVDLLATPHDQGPRRTPPEVLERSRLVARQRYEQSVVGAVRRGDYWTLVDLIRITADDRPSDLELARELGRTVGAVINARARVVAHHLRTYSREELEARLAGVFTS